MNDICRFFVDKDGWFWTNQTIGKWDPYTVGREKDKPNHSNITIGELSRQPDWKSKSHGGEALSTLIGGLFLDQNVTWVCVNYNRFRFEVANNSQRQMSMDRAKSILGVVVHQCIANFMRVEEVDDHKKVLSPEDRRRIAEEDARHEDEEEDEIQTDPFGDKAFERRLFGEGSFGRKLYDDDY